MVGLYERKGDFMINFKCVEAICRAVKKAYSNMQVNTYGYGDMQDYDKGRKFINKNEYIKACLIKGGVDNQFDFENNCFNMPEEVEFWWNGNMENIIDICTIMHEVAKRYGCSIIFPMDREPIKLVKGSVKYILENRWYNGKVDGWYGGRNKKYHELIDYVPKKEFAKKFEHFKDAKNSRDYLNKFDWNYHIVVIVE